MIRWPILLDYKSDIGFWKLLNIYIYFCFLSLSLFKKKNNKKKKKQHGSLAVGDPVLSI